MMWPKRASLLTAVFTVIVVILDIIYHRVYGGFERVYVNGSSYKLDECMMNASFAQESCNTTDQLIHLIHDAIEAVIEKQSFLSKAPKNFWKEA